MNTYFYGDGRRITHTGKAVKDNPFGFLIEAMAGGTSNAIEAQEKRGQQELAASTDLPTQGSDDPAFAKMGIVFGPPHPDDPMFRPATLPDGWSIKPSDHPMWSYIVDAKGRERASIFYKAAFYDRDAFINTQRRYTLGYDYISDERHNSLGERQFVVDNATGERVFAMPDVLRADYGEDRVGYFEAGDDARKGCKAWLKQNHPEWENAAAYWDEE